MTNEEVYFEAKKQGIDRIEKMVESGTLTREQADQQIDGMEYIYERTYELGNYNYSNTIYWFDIFPDHYRHILPLYKILI